MKSSCRPAEVLQRLIYSHGLRSGPDPGYHSSLEAMIDLLEEVKELSRETALSNRQRLRTYSSEDLTEKVMALRDSLLAAPSEAMTLFRLADIAARSAQSAEIGTAVWLETRATLLSLLNDWEKVEKVGEPEIEGIVQYYCKVLRDLAAKAEQEYRSYAESSEWPFFKVLIAELQQQEKRQEFLPQFYYWDFAVRIFRHLEQQTLLVEVEPTTEDLALHKFAIDCLLAIGRELLFQADKIADEEFARFSFSRHDLAAYVAELEHTLSEWHGDVEPAQANQLQERIFGGTA